MASQLFAPFSSEVDKTAGDELDKQEEKAKFLSQKDDYSEKTTKKTEKTEKHSIRMFIGQMRHAVSLQFSHGLLGLPACSNRSKPDIVHTKMTHQWQQNALSLQQQKDGSGGVMLCINSCRCQIRQRLWDMEKHLWNTCEIKTAL